MKRSTALFVIVAVSMGLTALSSRPAYGDGAQDSDQTIEKDKKKCEEGGKCKAETSSGQVQCKGSKPEDDKKCQEKLGKPGSNPGQ